MLRAGVPVPRQLLHDARRLTRCESLGLERPYDDAIYSGNILTALPTLGGGPQNAHVTRTKKVKMGQYARARGKHLLMVEENRWEHTRA